MLSNLFTGNTEQASIFKETQYSECVGYSFNLVYYSIEYLVSCTAVELALAFMRTGFF